MLGYDLQEKHRGSGLFSSVSFYCSDVDETEVCCAKACRKPSLTVILLGSSDHILLQSSAWPQPREPRLEGRSNSEHAYFGYGHRFTGLVATQTAT